MKMIHIILYFLALLSYTTHATSSVKDFCVANLLLPNTPSGYPCKPESLVTENDFVFSKLEPGIPIKPFNAGTTTVSVKNLAGLNGLGISVGRVDIGINGTVPMHTHPDATEVLIVFEGQMTAGFITPTKLIVKNLNPGDVFVFPKGLLHFQVNSGAGKAAAYIAYSSSNPNLHILDLLLFDNNLPTPTLQKTTLLDSAQINELKAQARAGQIGGSGLA
jgi:quercetin dioxygenase-like cupin family protein